MKLHKGLGLSAIGLAVALVASAPPAQADPVGDPANTFRPLAGMGSDTTYEVMNGLSEVVVVGGVKAIASYDPTPAGGVVSTKSEALLPNCNTQNGGGVVRANGSSAGRDLLTKAMSSTDPMSKCIDFARSSSGAIATGQTFVPLAQDGLAYAYPKGGDMGPATTLADLQLIYKCDAAVAGLFAPYIPQVGSGTRNSWATLMGISNTALPACVKDTFNGSIIQEHSGAPLQASNSVVPYSVAQYLSQMFGVSSDRRGAAQLGSIDGVLPLIQNPGQTTLRVVGNIIPTAKFTDSTSAEHKVFVNNGSGKSQICVNGKTTIEKYGFIAHTC